MTKQSNIQAAFLVAQSLKTGLYVTKMLGTPPFVGLALAEKHFQGDRWATVSEIADRATVSEDTARRRLNDLVMAGRAECKNEGGRHLYRIMPKLADAISKELGSQIIPFR